MVAAKSSKERTAEFRERRKDEGGRQVNIYLDADASTALDSITSRTGESKSTAVCRAVVKLDQEESSDKK